MLFNDDEITQIKNEEGLDVIVDRLGVIYVDYDGLCVIGFTKDLDGTSPIIIKPGTRYIGPQAFMDCPEIIKMILPSTIKQIWGNAFERTPTYGPPYDVKSVREFECDGILENIEIVDEPPISLGRFCGAMQIKSLYIQTENGKITPYAFRGWDKLEEVTINGHLHMIGRNAFWGCAELKKINLKDGCDSIDEYAFEGCPKLESINLSYFTSISEDSGLRKDIIPYGFNKNSFKNGDKIKVVVISKFHNEVFDFNLIFVKGGTIRHIMDDENSEEIMIKDFFIMEYPMNAALAHRLDILYKGCEYAKPWDIPTSPEVVRPDESLLNIGRWLKSLMRITGKPFRLPTGPEWELALRGGGDTTIKCYSTAHGLCEEEIFDKEQIMLKTYFKKNPNDCGYSSFAHDLCIRNVYSQSPLYVLKGLKLNDNKAWSMTTILNVDKYKNNKYYYSLRFVLPID